MENAIKYAGISILLTAIGVVLLFVWEFDSDFYWVTGLFEFAAMILWYYALSMLIQEILDLKGYSDKNAIILTFLFNAFALFYVLALPNKYTKVNQDKMLSALDKLSFSSDRKSVGYGDLPDL